MNFLITRRELTVITGIGRTATFALQKSGELRANSDSNCKNWFDLSHVLACAAALRKLPPPDEQCLAMHAQLVVELRLKNK